MQTNLSSSAGPNIAYLPLMENQTALRSNRSYIWLLLVILSTQFTPNFSFASWRQVEVAASVKGETALIGITEKESTVYESPKKCVFATFDFSSKKISERIVHRNSGFEFSANPTTAISSNGTLHVVCMSVMRDYSKGILEYSKSVDNGTTWTPFKTIVKRHNGIPDKPVLAANKDGSLLLGFTDIILDSSSGSLKVKGAIEYTTSTDDGESWSAPQNMASPPELQDSEFATGFQGTSVLPTSDGYLVAFSEYGGGGAYACLFTQRDGCKEIKLVTESSIQVPVIQITENATTNAIAITIQETHEFGQVYLAESKNKGASWMVKEVSTSGTMASLDFVNGKIVALIAEMRKNDSNSSVITSLLEFTSETLEKKSLRILEETRISGIAYLGAYQTLMKISEKKAAAFWISYADGNQLLKIDVISVD